MHRRVAVVAACLLVPMSWACHGLDCAGVGRPSFEIAVIDTRTGATIADSATAYMYEMPDRKLVDSATVTRGRIVLGESRGDFMVVVHGRGTTAGQVGTFG